MSTQDYEQLFNRTAEYAMKFLAGLNDRPVGRPADMAVLRTRMGGSLPV